MNQNRTMSILQRLPVILAVTAASYGLSPTQAQPVRHGGAATGGRTTTSLNHAQQSNAQAARAH